MLFFSLLFVTAVFFALLVAELFQHANLLIRVDQYRVVLLHLLFRLVSLPVKVINFTSQCLLARVAVLQVRNVDTARQEKTAGVDTKVLEVSTKAFDFCLQGEF